MTQTHPGNHACLGCVSEFCLRTKAVPIPQVYKLRPKDMKGSTQGHAPGLYWTLGATDCPNTGTLLAGLRVVGARCRGMHFMEVHFLWKVIIS